MVSKYTFTEKYNDLDILPWFGEFPKPLHVMDFDVDSDGVVERVISVMSSFASMFSGKGTSISFSTSESYASYDSQTMCVSTEALSYKLPILERIHAFFGHFIHESAHLLFTNPEAAEYAKTIAPASNPSDTLKQKVYNDQILAQLVNILEDRRIEHMMSVKYPGYNRYLMAARKAMIAASLVSEVEWEPTTETEALMNYITDTVLFPESLKQRPEDLLKIKRFVTDETLEKVDKITSRKLESYPQIIRAAKDIKNLFPSAACMSVSTKVVKSFKSITAGEPDDKLAKAIKEAVNSDKCKEVINGVSNDESMAEKSDKEIKHICPTDGNSNLYNKATIVQVKIKRKASQEHESLAKKLRASFSCFDANLNKIREMYEQDEGELDEDELYNATRQKDIFYEEEALPSSSMEIILLVDMSGSMSGTNIAKQRVIANAICKAFSNNPKINFQMYGHTANTNGASLVIFPFVTKKLKYNPDRVASMEACANNADGYALEYIYSKFSNTKTANKLVLMMSDGYPAASRYGGASAAKHVRSVVEEGEKRGIQVLSIAIGNFDQDELYKHIIPYSGEDVGKKISTWITNHFKERIRKYQFKTA